MNEWRHNVAITVAIILWLLTWYAGWYAGATLSSGGRVVTAIGALLGWLAGLGIATLILYLDERL